MVANYDMKVNSKFLKFCYKSFTKIMCSALTYIFTAINIISHMNTRSNSPLYQSRKKYVFIKFKEIFVEVLIVVSCTKMCIGYNCYFQSSPLTAIRSVSSSIKFSRPLFLSVNFFFGLYTSSSGSITFGSNPITE